MRRGSGAGWLAARACWAHSNEQQVAEFVCDELFLIACRQSRLWQGAAARAWQREKANETRRRCAPLFRARARRPRECCCRCCATATASADNRLEQGDNHNKHGRQAALPLASLRALRHVAPAANLPLGFLVPAARATATVAAVAALEPMQ